MSSQNGRREGEGEGEGEGRWWGQRRGQKTASASRHCTSCFINTTQNSWTLSGHSMTAASKTMINLLSIIIIKKKKTTLTQKSKHMIQHSESFLNYNMTKQNILLIWLNKMTRNVDSSQLNIVLTKCVFFSLRVDAQIACAHFLQVITILHNVPIHSHFANLLVCGQPSH